MNDNEGLSLKELSLNIVALLGLTAPKRGSELTELDLSFMGKTETTYLFHLTKPTKNFKPGKKIEPIEFKKFDQERRICP